MLRLLKHQLNRMVAFERLYTNLFERTEIGRLLARHRVTCIDVGSRHGFERDLLPIAFAVDGIGFEPDPDAFATLQARGAGPWHSLRHLPFALARTAGRRDLNVPVHAGSASLLEHDARYGERFHRRQYFEVRAKLPVQTHALDDVLPADIDAPAFLKLDVEGMELEIVEGAPRVLASIVAAKVEVSFLPFRRGQPLASDIEQFFRDRGFEVADLLRPARWRIYAPNKLDRHQVHVPFSRGQLMHGDYLLFRNPEHISQPHRRLAAAAIAMSYGFFDHALACIDGEPTRTWLRAQGVADPVSAIAEASRTFAAAARKTALKDVLLQLRSVVASRAPH